MALEAGIAGRYSMDAAVHLDPGQQADLETLVDWVYAAAPSFAVTVESVRVWPWRSAETPSNRETAVDVLVRGEEAQALQFWMAAADFAAKLPAAAPSRTKAPLTVDVHWQ